MKYVLILFLVLWSLIGKSQSYQIPSKSKLTPIDIKLDLFPNFEGEISLRVDLHPDGTVLLIYINQVRRLDGSQISQEEEDLIIKHYCSRIEKIIFTNKTRTINLVVHCKKST